MLWLIHYLCTLNTTDFWLHQMRSLVDKRSDSQLLWDSQILLWWVRYSFQLWSEKQIVQCKFSLSIRIRLQFALIIYVLSFAKSYRYGLCLEYFIILRCNDVDVKHYLHKIKNTNIHLKIWYIWFIWHICVSKKCHIFLNKRLWECWVILITSYKQKRCPIDSNFQRVLRTENN